MIRLILFCGIIVLLCYLYNRIKRKFFTFETKGCFVMVDGSPKTGKTAFGVAISRAFTKHQKKLVDGEKPLLYSNIPIKPCFVPLTTELISRKSRPRYGSCIFIDEASLVADSRLALSKDSSLNERINLFNKLIGHEMHGGLLVYNTQCPDDLHIGIRRCTGTIVHIDKTVSIPILPFVVCKYRCMDYLDGKMIPTDPEHPFSYYVYSKRIFKSYDRYAFSSFTDDLPVEDNLVTPHSLKVDNVVSFNPFSTLKKDGDSNEKNS